MVVPQVEHTYSLLHLFSIWCWRGDFSSLVPRFELGKISDALRAHHHLGAQFSRQIPFLLWCRRRDFSLLVPRSEPGISPDGRYPFLHLGAGKSRQIPFLLWCRRRDLNPHEAMLQRILSPLCLPVPSLRQLSVK